MNTNKPESTGIATLSLEVNIFLKINIADYNKYIRDIQQISSNNW